VYALGVLLYQLLTGVGPFSNDSPSELLIAQLSLPPLPMGERVPVPFSANLEGFVSRCLSKFHGDRFESVAAFLDALEALQSPGSPRVSNAPKAPVPALATASSKPQPSRLRAPTQAAPRAPLQPNAPNVAAPVAAPASTGSTRDVLRALQPLAAAVVALTFLCGIAAGFVAAKALRPDVAVGTLTVPHTLSRTIRLRVHSPVRDARATIRGTTYLLPVDLNVVAAEVPEMIEVTAPGHQTQGMWTTLNEAVDSQIDLSAIPPTVAPVALATTRNPTAERRVRRTRRAR
jgi:hypothetical protein